MLNAIDRILNDSNERAAMAEAGIDVARKFSWERALSRMEETLYVLWQQHLPGEPYERTRYDRYEPHSVF